MLYKFIRLKRPRHHAVTSATAVGVETDVDQHALHADVLHDRHRAVSVGIGITDAAAISVVTIAPGSNRVDVSLEEPCVLAAETCGDHTCGCDMVNEDSLMGDVDSRVAADSHKADEVSRKVDAASVVNEDSMVDVGFHKVVVVPVVEVIFIVVDIVDPNRPGGA